MGNKIVICTVASNDYLSYLERLLASAQLYLPDQIIQIVLVNVDELKVEYLKSLYGNINFDLDYIRFNNIDEIRGWCTNRRALLFPELMKRYNCPIVWMDADSIFINPAEELVEYAKKYDLSVDYTHNHNALITNPKKLHRLSTGPLGTPYYGVFNNSIIITNNSPIAKKMFIFFSNLIKNHCLIWYADQEGLYLSYKKYEDNINFKPLNEKYCSRVFKPDRIIWTAKANIKDRKKYIELGNEYINRVRKWPLKELNISRNPQDNITPHNPIMVKNKSIISRVYNRLYRTTKFLLTGKVRH